MRSTNLLKRSLGEVDRQHLYRINYRQADPDTLDEQATAA
jgi:hypothetical protein